VCEVGEAERLKVGLGWRNGLLFNLRIDDIDFTNLCVFGSGI
jgi:hypothetical protein